MSFFNQIDTLPEDPILGLALLFAQDKHPKKVNLGIGAYRDNHGQPLVLQCVKKAEKLLLDKNLNKEYLPIQGFADYITSTQQLIFGSTLQLCQNRLFGLQTIGGTGALRVGAEFLFRSGFKKICIPDPTWANHLRVFQYAGLEVTKYPYYNVQDKTLDFDGLVTTLSQLPEKTIVLLHACCHNPSGIDPSQEQWQLLSELMKKKNLIPFFDLAYQGFGVSLDEDAYAIRLFVEQGHEIFIAQSYAKSMGLYGERAGSLTLIVKTPELLKSVSSHLKQIVRSMYSNPPLQSERIVTTILQDKSLYQQWVQELSEMRNRIDDMRKTLEQQLRIKNPQFNFPSNQKGMFYYLGLTHEQVQQLRSDFGIYVADGGRANLAGLNSNNIELVTDALNVILKNQK